MEPAAGVASPVAVQELKDMLRATDGWLRLVRSYGGNAERCLVGHLKESAAKGGKLSVAAAHARIQNTLAYRRENELDRPDVLHDVETARCRSFWPYAFAESAPDGSPVEVCRLSRLSPQRILDHFPEDEGEDGR